MDDLNSFESFDEFLTTLSTLEFREKFSELECCAKEKQIQNIDEMNKIMKNMRWNELESVLSTELLNKIDNMIEEKTLSQENAILLTKKMGYHNALNETSCLFLNNSLLMKKFVKMVFEEEKKKEGKNVELLIDLCKCCLLLCECLPNELYHICVPNLLKLALEKEENKERQKEVELALLALSTIDEFIIIQKKLYIFEITEIIHHYQQQHSLTHLAYLSAWRFLMNRMQNEKSVECMMTNELHFFREATSELEELSRYVAWEKKEMGAEDITHIIIKWCEMLCEFFPECKFKVEYDEFIQCLVRLFRMARENNDYVSDSCIETLMLMCKWKAVNANDLKKCGFIDLILEEIEHATLKDELIRSCLNFLINLSKRLNGKVLEIFDEESEEESMEDNEENEEDNGKEIEKEKTEAEMKITKREIFSKFEEKGYEDVMMSFQQILGS